MLVQEDVLGLQVTVQDLLGVHMVQGQEDLHKEVQDGVLIQQGITALVDELCQSAPCKEQQKAEGTGSCTGQHKPGLKLRGHCHFGILTRQACGKNTSWWDTQHNLQCS